MFQLFFMVFIIFSIDTLFLYLRFLLSGYKESGGYPFLKVYLNKNTSKNIGIYGEYLTFMELKKFRRRGAKILVNVYIFNSQYDSTEIDLIMIDKTGIYVFESKNLKGFIYGKASDISWHQKVGNEYFSFANPISQNKKHIKYINSILEYKYNDNIYSYIVFSERCSLGHITYPSNVKIVKRENLFFDIKRKIKNGDNVLTKEDIDFIYDKLKEGINVSEEVKNKHIENIKNKQNLRNSYLKKIDLSMGIPEYQMYQDIPKEEGHQYNSLFGVSYEEFKSKMNYYMKCEYEIEPKIESCTNRYVYYINDKPIGEILVRTTLSEKYLKRNSQIYFRIRNSERGKGYASRMLELCLIECKNLGFKEVHLNCRKDNIPAIHTILNNGGIMEKESENSYRYEIVIK